MRIGKAFTDGSVQEADRQHAREYACQILEQSVLALPRHVFNLEETLARHFAFERKQGAEGKQLRLEDSIRRKDIQKAKRMIESAKRRRVKR